MQTAIAGGFPRILTLTGSVDQLQKLSLAINQAISDLETFEAATKNLKTVRTIE